MNSRAFFRPTVLFIELIALFAYILEKNAVLAHRLRVRRQLTL